MMEEEEEDELANRKKESERRRSKGSNFVWCVKTRAGGGECLYI